MDILQAAFNVTGKKLTGWGMQNSTLSSCSRAKKQVLFTFSCTANIENKTMMSESQNIFLWSVIISSTYQLSDLQYEPRHKKTCLRGFRPGKTQTGMLSYRDKLESWNFGFCKYRYYTIEVANNKGADQTAQMRRLICAFVVPTGQKQVFSWRGSNNVINILNREEILFFIWGSL